MQYQQTTCITISSITHFSWFCFLFYLIEAAAKEEDKKKKAAKKKLDFKEKKSKKSDEMPGRLKASKKKSLQRNKKT